MFSHLARLVNMAVATTVLNSHTASTVALNGLMSCNHCTSKMHRTDIAACFVSSETCIILLSGMLAMPQKAGQLLTSVTSALSRYPAAFPTVRGILSTSAPKQADQEVGRQAP